MAGNSTDPGRSVTSKVTAILMVFADGGVHTLTEIACCANLPTSTAHRLASELVAWRLLERTEERSYRIGLPLRMIASEYSESEVWHLYPDGDARPAGAARTVQGDPQRGAPRRSARFRCADLAAAYQPVLRTRECRRPDACRHTRACDRGGQSAARLLPDPGSSTVSSTPGCPRSHRTPSPHPRSYARNSRSSG